MGETQKSQSPCPTDIIKRATSHRAGFLLPRKSQQEQDSTEKHPKKAGAPHPSSLKKGRWSPEFTSKSHADSAARTLEQIWREGEREGMRM